MAKADLLLALTNERTRLIALVRNPAQATTAGNVLPFLDELKKLDDLITIETARP